MITRPTLGVVLLAALAAPSGPAQEPEYRHFEGRQTHPLRLSADGSQLFGLNTPDGRLSVFALGDGDAALPTLVSEIPVGCEPVSLAEGTDGTVWVVNEVSDTVSVVSLERGVAVAHLAAGDEPADVVFAGGKAFVTAARENKVRVFNATTRERIADIVVNALFPRAMAVSPDGARIYVAAQMSGNRTTVLRPNLAPAPPAPTNPALPPAPQTGLIVADSHPAIPYTVLDHDVVEIDAATLTVDRYFSGAGTILLDLAVSPDGSHLWVANTEALNLIRFEPALRGHFVDNRVTRIAVDTGVAAPFDLNPGVDYGVLPNPVAQTTAIAQPTAVVFEPDGEHLWVAGFGSDLVARVRASDGAVVQRIDVGPTLEPGETSRSEEKRGPRGLALDTARSRLYVLNRLSNSLSVLDTQTGSVLGEIMVGSHDPTPPEIRAGRGFLYDARLSGNGTNSCASCHIDGDRDGVAWDLGDPGGEMVFIEGENRVVHDLSGNESPPTKAIRALHPMKGPKVTQTLRGMITEPLLVADGQHPSGVSTRAPLFHWRGDRTSLADFNATFDDLMGGSEVAADGFSRFEAFLKSVRLHPNPHRNLDRGTPATIAGGDPVAGRANFLNHGLSHCVVCHPVPSGTDQNIDEINNSSTVDFLKTPPLMLSYQKQGIFNPGAATTLSGYGFGHDGTQAALPLPHFYFLSTMNTQQLIDTRAFVLAFDSIVGGTSPAVGHQLLVTPANAAAPEVAATLALLEANADPARAATNRYWNDLAATGILGGSARALRFDPATNRYLTDRGSDPPRTRAELLASLGGDDILTFEGVAPWGGSRRGGDRDGDGLPDGDQAAPSLEIASMPEAIRVEWSHIGPDFFLESRDLSPPHSWGPELRVRSDGDGSHTLELPLPLPPGLPPSAIFRLRKTW